MESMHTPHDTWAAMALLAFLRRTFTQLAVSAEKDAKAYRMALKRMGGVS
jgi:hypothetical protein